MILIILNFNEKKNESEIFNFQSFITNLFLFKQLFKLLHVLNIILNKKINNEICYGYKAKKIKS
jgi:hypothetical protein